MISRIKGNLIKREENYITVEVGGIFYEVNTPGTVSERICETEGSPIELTIYHYLHMDKSKGIPVLIGFIDELEKDFFEKFIMGIQLTSFLGFNINNFAHKRNRFLNCRINIFFVI